jgi:hypothetical protein
VSGKHIGNNSIKNSYYKYTKVVKVVVEVLDIFARQIKLPIVAVRVVAVRVFIISSRSSIFSTDDCSSYN